MIFCAMGCLCWNRRSRCHRNLCESYDPTLGPGRVYATHGVSVRSWRPHTNKCHGNGVGEWTEENGKVSLKVVVAWKLHTNKYSMLLHEAKMPTSVTFEDVVVWPCKQIYDIPLQGLFTSMLETNKYKPKSLALWIQDRSTKKVKVQSYKHSSPSTRWPLRKNSHTYHIALAPHLQTSGLHPSSSRLAFVPAFSGIYCVINA